MPWSNSGSPAPLALQRTVESALRAEVSPNPGGARATGQWVRRALPLTISGQGVVADAGLPAIAIGTTGELAPRPDEPVKRARMGSFGRGLLRAVTAIDEAGPIDPDRAARSPAFSAGPEGIVTMRNVLPDWAVRMLVGTLLLPALLAALDGWFRARRRHLRVGRWAGLGRRLRAARRCWRGCGCACSALTGALTVPADARGAGPVPARDGRDRRARLDRARRRRRLVRRAAAARRAASRRAGAPPRAAWPPPPGWSSTCSPR